MKRKYLLIALVVILLVGIGYRAMAVSEKSESNRIEDGKKQKVLSTGLEDQTGVALTIYNVNLGLVKDQREIKLAKGTGELRFMDVASQIIPTSVHIKSLIAPESLHVLSRGSCEKRTVQRGRVL